MNNYNNSAVEAGKAYLDKYLSSKHKKVILSNLIISSSELLLNEPVHIEWMKDAPVKGIQKSETLLAQLGLDKIQLKGYWPLPAVNFDAMGVIHQENEKAVIMVDACFSSDKFIGIEYSPYNIPERAEFYANVQKSMGCRPSDWTGSELGLRFAYLYLLNEVLNVPSWYALINFQSPLIKPSMNLISWNEYYHKEFQALGIHKGCRLLEKLIMVYPPLQD